MGNNEDNGSKSALAVVHAMDEEILNLKTLLKITVAEKETQISELMDQMVEKDEQISHLSNQVSDLTRQLLEKNDVISHMTSEVTGLKTHTTEQGAILIGMHKDFTLLRDRILQSQETNSSLTEEMKHSKQIISTKEEKCNQLEQQVFQLESRLVKTNAELEHLAKAKLQLSQQPPPTIHVTDDGLEKNTTEEDEAAIDTQVMARAKELLAEGKGGTYVKLKAALATEFGDAAVSRNRRKLQNISAARMSVKVKKGSAKQRPTLSFLRKERPRQQLATIPDESNPFLAYDDILTETTAISPPAPLYKLHQSQSHRQRPTRQPTAPERKQSLQQRPLPTPTTPTQPTLTPTPTPTPTQPLRPTPQPTPQQWQPTQRFIDDEPLYEQLSGNVSEGLYEEIVPQRSTRATAATATNPIVVSASMRTRPTAKVEAPPRTASLRMSASQRKALLQSEAIKQSLAQSGEEPGNNTRPRMSSKLTKGRDARSRVSVKRKPTVTRAARFEDQPMKKAPKDDEHISVVKSNNLGRHKSVRWFQSQEKDRGVGQDVSGRAFDWFHGVISRSKAEELLKKSPEWSFLVRVSESRFGYVLSVRGSKQASKAVHHYMIEQNRFNHYGLLSWNEDEIRYIRDPICPSLDQLIDHFSTYRMHVECDVLGEPCVHDNDSQDLDELFGSLQKQGKEGSIKLQSWLGEQSMC
eukprot:m.170335 g.170335  ORF g.170335 m.170335 type:complete len:694 (-) comp31608_c2_seq4:151-2232(-)